MMANAAHFAPSGRGFFGISLPRALPWAISLCRVAACNSPALKEQNVIAQGKRSATLGHELIEVLSPERAKLFSPAPTELNAIAQGNALGMSESINLALKGRNAGVSPSNEIPNHKR